MAEISNPQRHGGGEFLHLGGLKHFTGHPIPATVDFTRWHTLALDWLPGHITFWLDGKALWTVQSRSGPGNYVPSTPFHLALQNDEGCDVHCQPNQDTPKQVIMQVDWVKIYAAPGTTAPAAAALSDPGSRGVHGTAYSPDGKYLATADANGHVYVWGLPSDHLVSTLTDPSSRGTSAVAFSPDNSALAIGDADGHIYLSRPPAFQTLTGAAGQDITAVAFTPDGRYLAAADANGHVYVWTVATGKILATLSDPGSRGVHGTAYSPDGKYLATADGNGHVYLWALPDYQLRATLTDPGSLGASTVAFSPDSTAVASADENGTTYIHRTSA